LSLLNIGVAVNKTSCKLHRSCKIW